jgi:glycosyltransferase involved in cell wall biosynthesis
LNILFLTRYNYLGASSRLRGYQFIKYFKNSGHTVSVSPFFSNDYLIDLYGSNRKRLRHIFKAYITRMLAVMSFKKYSIIWVEKEVFPFLPSLFEKVIIISRVPYIVDYDDAIFHSYDRNKYGFIRLILKNKLDSLLSNSSCVTVGNHYLENYVASHGAKKVVKLPTVIDINKYQYSFTPRNREFRIGWIGTPATQKYLSLIIEPLLNLKKLISIRLVTIGAKTLKGYGVPLEQHSWKEETEGEIINSFHVGIMPLYDDYWERGKCGYKLIQYMACGKPVVGSPVGINRSIITENLGFLANNSVQWERSLFKLADDEGMREAFGLNARAIVEKKYSQQVIAPQIMGIFTSAELRKI